MPQMSPLMWLPLFLFFLFSLILFLVLNYFIKPFETITSYKDSYKMMHPSWKL